MQSRAFPFVHSITDRHGKRRHYFRRTARIASPEFQDAYRKALAGENAPPIEIGSRCSKPGSVAAAVALYLGSIDFGNLADVTRRERRRILDRFREAYDRPFAGLERNTSSR